MKRLRLLIAVTCGASHVRNQLNVTWYVYVTVKASASFFRLATSRSAIFATLSLLPLFYLLIRNIVMMDADEYNKKLIRR